jgi:hypothetical protein
MLSGLLDELILKVKKGEKGNRHGLIVLQIRRERNLHQPPYGGGYKSVRNGISRVTRGAPK